MIKRVINRYKEYKKKKELKLWEMSLDIKNALINFIIDYQASNDIIDTPQNIVRMAFKTYNENVKSPRDIKKYYKMLVNFKKGA